MPGSKRDFLKLATGAVAVCGAGFATWPLLAQMRASSDVQRPREVSFAGWKEGQFKIFGWHDAPYILRRRTSAEIEQTLGVNVLSLRDKDSRNANLNSTQPATVENRSFGANGQYVLFSPVCTGYPCSLDPPQAEDPAQPFVGVYFCKCCAARFDSLGRVFSGATSTNLSIPKFIVRADTVYLGTDLPFSAAA